MYKMYISLIKMNNKSNFMGQFNILMILVTSKPPDIILYV
jgi:hypothetical protein